MAAARTPKDRARRAEEAAERFGLSVPTGQARHARALLLLVDGRPAEAAREALEVAELFVVPGRTARGRSLDGTLDSLTGREREIADLVTARKTNREIAADLFLSEKTVETHLRNIFGKLVVAEGRRAARRGRARRLALG